MTGTKHKKHITSEDFGIPADFADLAENYAQWRIQALSEQLAEAQAALKSACFLIDASKLTCHHLHHSTKDFHKWDETCGVEAIAKERLESVRAAMKGAA